MEVLVQLEGLQYIARKSRRRLDVDQESSPLDDHQHHFASKNRGYRVARG